MASETSGACVGVCEHPTRTPTASSASEAKHTGKVLILDLLITYQAVLECPLYCRTLLPNYPQSTSGRLGTCPVLAWKSARAAFVADGANPATTLQRGPSPRATAAPY